MTCVQSAMGDFDMLNSWFAITFHAARLGFEAQNAVAFRLIRLIGDASKTEAGESTRVEFSGTIGLDLGLSVNLLGQSSQANSLKSRNGGAERDAGNSRASADLNAAENRCTVFHVGH
jgi:hypothetical protein